MPMTPDQQRAMLSELADDPFAPLDLSNYPSLQEPPPEQTRDDGRFAKHWTDTPLNASAAALRAFVSDPDAAALDRVGQETGNPELRAEVRDRRGETIAEQFRRAVPEYFASDDNYEKMVQTMSYNALSHADQQEDIDVQVEKLLDAGYWTLGNLKATYEALRANGLLDVPEGSTRALTSTERLRVTRLGQSGRVDAAIPKRSVCRMLLKRLWRRPRCRRRKLRAILPSNSAMTTGWFEHPSVMHKIVRMYSSSRWRSRIPPSPRPRLQALQLGTVIACFGR